MKREEIGKATQQKQQNSRHKKTMAAKNFFLLVMVISIIEQAMLQRPSLNDNSPWAFNIGGVLSSGSSEDHFRDIITVSRPVSPSITFHCKIDIQSIISYVMDFSVRIPFNSILLYSIIFHNIPLYLWHVVDEIFNSP